MGRGGTVRPWDPTLIRHCAKRITVTRPPEGCSVCDVTSADSMKLAVTPQRCPGWTYALALRAPTWSGRRPPAPRRCDLGGGYRTWRGNRQKFADRHVRHLAGDMAANFVLCGDDQLRRTD